MKKQDLLKYFDDYLLDKLFGFCYARTNDSYEAEELCSDIIYALVKAAHSDGEIESVYPFKDVFEKANAAMQVAGALAGFGATVLISEAYKERIFRMRKRQRPCILQRYS